MTSLSAPGVSQRVLEANLRALRRTSPGTVKELEQWARRGAPSGPGVRIVETPSGFPTLEREGWGFLHSRYDPVREAEAWATRVPASDGLVVVYGLGLAYHVEVLLRIRKPVRVMAIEPEPAVAWALLRTRPLERLLGNPRFQLLLTEPRKQFHAELNTAVLSGVAAGGWTLQVFPSYARWYAGDIEELNRWLIDTVRSHRGNVATYQRWMRAWIHHPIDNLKYVAGRPFVDRWFGVLTGQPAVLVAAGPSVTPNLPAIARLKGKVPIVAAGSGLGPLVQAGIEPDLVVSIDSGEANYRHFEGRDLAAPLVFSPEIYPRIVEEYRGPLVPMATMGGTTFQYICHLAGVRPSLIPSGPSVANVAVALLRALGANPIVLVGQDLAYPGGRSHAAGVPTAVEIDVTRRDLLMVEGVGGGRVPTDRGLQAMRYWLEEYLAAVPDLCVINTSQVGARIRGAQEMTLGEAVRRFHLDQARSLAGVFADPPAHGHHAPPALAQPLETLLHRIADDAVSAQRALDQVRDAGSRALDLLSKPSPRASRVQAALAHFERRRARFEESAAYRYFLREVLNYQRLALAQVQDDTKSWLKRYLVGCQRMSEALETLQAAVRRQLGTV